MKQKFNVFTAFILMLCITLFSTMVAQEVPVEILETTERSPWIALIISFIDKYFMDQVAMMIALMSVSQALIKLIDKQFPNFYWNKYTKIISHFIVWLAMTGVGVYLDVGFLAEISYPTALQLTLESWLGASGVYTIFSAIFGDTKVGSMIFKTKNQEDK